MKVTIRKRRARQQRIEFSAHGGKRRGAGRKRTGGRRRVPHRRRPVLDGRTPVHVTLRIAGDVPYLRNYERCKVLRRAFCACRRGDFRVCEFSIQSNHLHLICEAGSSAALARGMQGFKGRVTRGLNALCAGRRGTVWDDRYHGELLRSPRQVRAALCYVLNNFRRHRVAPAGHTQVCDPFSSGRYFDGWATAPPGGIATRAADEAPVASAKTWLLSAGWQRHGLIRLDEVPAAGRR